MKPNLALAIALCAALAAGPVVAQVTLGQDRGTSTRALPPPDFAMVRSLDDAEVLFARGQLVPVMLMPYEFGGDDRPENLVYVPPEAAQAKREIDQTILGLVEQDLLDQMTVNLEYRGDSFVPSRIVIQAWHSGRDGRYEPTVEVW